MTDPTSGSRTPIPLEQWRDLVAGGLLDPAVPVRPAPQDSAQ